MSPDKRPFEGYVDQPDTAERVRRQVQAIPFALPAKRVKWDSVGDEAVWPSLPEGRDPCP